MKTDRFEMCLYLKLTTSISWDNEKSNRTLVGSEWLSEGLASGLYSFSKSLTSLYSNSSAITKAINLKKCMIWTICQFTEINITLKYN